MKRLAKVFLPALLISVIFLFCPPKAVVHAKWVSVGGSSETNPYSIQVIEMGPAVLRLQIGVGGFNLETAGESATKLRRITLPDFTPTFEAGSPDVPQLVRALRVPDGASPRFEIVEQNSVAFENVQVDPSRGPIVIGQDPAQVKVRMGPPYKVDRLFPPKIFDLVEPFQIRDTSGVKFVFSPFRYNPVSRELHVITRFVVDIFFDPTDENVTAGAGGSAGEKTNKTRKHGYSPAFERIEAAIFLNGPTPPSAWGSSHPLKESRSANAISAMDSSSSGSESMLIITTSKYSSTLQSFIQWKQSRGIYVILDTTSATGGVSAIQNTIQTTYDNQGLTYVILVGNLQDVPSPMVTLISQKPSDPYYVALSGSNTVASAMISRILVSSVTELKTELAKSMSYGQGPFSNDSWVNNALVGACASNPNDTGEANSIIGAMLAHPFNFTSAQRVISTDNNPSQTVINAFEKTGVNMFTYVGHGTQTMMSSLSFTSTQAAKLTGGNGAYPFVHTVACDLGDFSYTGGECFAQSILAAGSSSAPAGAVAIAASTEDMYAGQGDIGQQAAFTNYYYSTQYETIGTLFFSSTAYAISCLTGTLAETLYRQWHLFGDCSLPIRKLSSQTPTASVTLPAQVYEGAGTLSGQGTVTLSKPAPSALVVYLSSSDLSQASVPVSVVVPQGAASASFDINVLDDELVSGDQTVQICASISGWTTGCAQMTIVETGGLVQFSSPTYVAADGSANITLVRTGYLNGSISVNVQTSDGTALAGTDYTAQNAAVDFADGESQQTVAVPLIPDPYEEPAKTFNVSISGTFAGSLNSALVTIPSNYTADYFTEQSLSGANLSYNSVSFIPNGSPNYYSAYVNPVSTFFTDPTGGTPLQLGDDSYAQVNLSGGAAVSLYGSSYSALFVGSNGYITFTSGDSTSTPSLPAHFLLPRISALFDNLSPSAAGSVTWKQLTGCVAITFLNVPEKGTSNANSFQVEMFFNGAIRITWLGVQASNVLVGLSSGPGQVPSGFAQSLILSYGSYAWQVSTELLGAFSSGSVSESAGQVPSAGSIAVSSPLFFDLSVELTSSDPTRLTLPASLTIPAGQTQVQFGATVINDCIADGDHTITITASAENGNAVQSSIFIKDAGELPGDLNHNCVVDYDDLNILLAYLGMPSQACPGCDLDGAASIDVDDVTVLKSLCTCAGCVCAGTQQQTDPPNDPTNPNYSSQPAAVPALGIFAYVLLMAACGLLLIIRPTTCCQAQKKQR